MSCAAASACSRRSARLPISSSLTPTSASELDFEEGSHLRLPPLVDGERLGKGSLARMRPVEGVGLCRLRHSSSTGLLQALIDLVSEIQRLSSLRIKAQLACNRCGLLSKGCLVVFHFADTVGEPRLLLDRWAELGEGSEDLANRGDARTVSVLGEPAGRTCLGPGSMPAAIGVRRLFEGSLACFQLALAILERGP